MGELRVGDLVSTPDGGSARISGVFPQGTVAIYRVRFVDGRVVEACGDHLWEVHHKHWSGKYRPGVSRAGAARPRILSTLDLRSLLARNKGVFSVRLAEPLPKPEAELPVDPYVLGCLLGDGTLTRLQFTNPTPSIAGRMNARLPPGLNCRRVGPIDYRLVCGGGGRLPGGAWRVHPLRLALQSLGLAGCRSWEKHIPGSYKEAAVAQRLALLRGLMDTDGTVDARLADLSYATSSPQLARDVQELVWSLGGIARITSKIPVYTYRGERRQGRRAYRVHIRHPRPRDLFADASKRERIVGEYQYANSLKLRICAIEPAGEAPAQCIAIEHPDHLYVTDGYVVTHNTRLFDLLVTQAVLRREAVVIIDPKGDQDLRHAAERACRAAGEASRFVHFHPAFPQDSARIDPLHSFNRATELASRVAALIPSETGNDPFKAFGQMAMSNVVQGLLAVGERPSLVTLRRYLEGGAESLIERVLVRYLGERVPAWEGEAKPFLRQARDTTARVAGLVRYYRDVVRARHPSTVVDGLASLFEHERVHFSKMIASLMPILNMLTSADLGPLLSPDAADPRDPRRLTSMAECIERAQVVYLGLDALSDSMVGSAIGSILVADLAAVAGDRYNYGVGLKPVNVFIDEAAEVVNDPFIQLLNKGRGAGLRLTIATQTFADFAARTGSEAKARQVLGNINNLVALRVLDAETQQYVTDSLPKTRLKSVLRTQASTTHAGNPLLYTGSVGERLGEEEGDLFPPALLGQLPNLHYLAILAGGRVVKGRLPILKVEEREGPSPDHRPVPPTGAVAGRLVPKTVRGVG
jgi:conjugal transfer pilus assembly protein TraD